MNNMACSKRRWFFQGLFLLIGMGLMLTSKTCHATAVGSYEQLIAYLNDEKTNLSSAAHEAQAWAVPDNVQASHQAMDQIEQLRTLTQAKIVVFERFLATQQQHQRELSNQLKKIQRSSVNHLDEQAIEGRIQHINERQDMVNKAIDLIQQDLALARQYQAALLVQSHQLVVWRTGHQTKEKLAILHEKMLALEKQRAALYVKNTVLDQKQSTMLFSQESRLNYEKALFINNQHILLIDDDMSVLQWQMEMEKANDVFIKEQDINALKTMIMLEEKIIEQLQQRQALTEKKSRFLFCTEPSKLMNQALKQACLSLKKDAQNQQKQLLFKQQELQNDLLAKQALLRKQLASRQRLTEYSFHIWSDLLDQMTQIPLQFYQYVRALIINIGEQYLEESFVPALLFWFMLISIGVLAITLHYKLAPFAQDKARSRLSAHLYDGVVVLFHRSIAPLTCYTMIMAIMLFNQVPYGHYRLLIHLTFVGLVCYQAILIAKLVLLERLTDASGHDVVLYHRLKWIVFMGGVSTGLMILSHELPLSFLLQDIFDRLFMLFLLVVSGVAWQSHDVILHVSSSALASKKRHVRHVASILRWLIPMTLSTTALIGLIGYVNLAWTMSRYQAYFLVVLIGYVLVRGLLRDMLDLLSEWMVDHLHNGWLWIEALLKPMDKLIRLVLLALSLFILLQWTDVLTDPRLLSSALAMGQYVFIDWSGVRVTAFSLLEFTALLVFFIWASKWSREFCYRWLYAHVLDAGIRNSLSVFTQYAIVLLGCVVTLRVLGVDFTGMMVVLGGLAVGMGFGLRDFASNIVGGVMLLIERPVREGDLVTIGEYEGKVAHIGIRSMRVSSWDNMEVLVPNAETFNKPFTNWTHQDSIVRTVVPIKVSRADDPVTVQQLIHDALKSIPEILHEPPQQVFLKQIDEALIEFEVRYFINVQSHTRFEVRSNLLFAIMTLFKHHGIQAPIPPLSVELKSREDHHKADDELG